MIKKELLAYTAGYIDGDGCFTISKQRHFFRGAIYIVSTYKPIILFFKKTFGGGCSTKKRSQQRPRDKTTHHFFLTGEKAAELAEMILPFLVEKRKQAECFLKFFQTTNKSVKDQCIIKMKTLKNDEDFVCKNHIETLKQIKESIPVKTIDFPYITGFIDAECSLGIYKHQPKDRINPKYKQTLQLGNTKLPCFEFFSKRFGGCFMFSKKQNRHHDQIHYKLSSKKLRDILPQIIPFLKNKKKVCEELIRFNELIKRETRCKKSGQFMAMTCLQLEAREKIRNKINHLNTRGC